MITLDYLVPPGPLARTETLDYLSSILQFGAPGGVSTPDQATLDYLGLSGGRSPATAVVSFVPESMDEPAHYLVRVLIEETSLFLENFSTHEARISALQHLFRERISRCTGGVVRSRPPEFS